METKFPIIGNTEEVKTGVDGQQCLSDEIIEIPDSPPPAPPTRQHPENDVIVIDDLSSPTTEMYSQCEPIDLTIAKSSISGNSKESEILKPNYSKKIIIQEIPTGSSFANSPEILKKRQHSWLGDYQQSPDYSAINPTLQRPHVLAPTYYEPNFSKTPPPSHISFPHGIHHLSNISNVQQQPILLNQSSKQQDVLKMAKSIFSKRTRTLYYWMYPSASKQQIKDIVSNMWDSMAEEEKNIYISQVLSRFGQDNCNLMVNPQLGHLKELSPLTENFGYNPKATELQNAISSIANEPNNVEGNFSEGTENEPQRKKPKLTRKRLAQNLATASQEFDDDPELSNELAQFSVLFRNQF